MGRTTCWSNVGVAVVNAHAACSARVAELCSAMTPLYDRLSALLPTKVARVTLAIIYAALIVLIVTFLISPTQFELVYLDVGR